MRRRFASFLTVVGTAAASALAGAVLSPAPAFASDALTMYESDYLCGSGAPGVRVGWFFAQSNVASSGVITAISLQPGGGRTDSTGVGTVIGPNGRPYVNFADSSGASSISFSVTVHWDTGPAGTPLDATVSASMNLNPCQRKPTVTLTSLCSGSVLVTMANGKTGDLKDAGGAAMFQVSAANGYSKPNIGINMAQSGTETVPAADASWVRVTSNDTGQVWTGSYQPTPGCYGYTPPAGVASAASPPRQVGPGAGSTTHQPQPTTEPGVLAGAPVTSPWASPQDSTLPNSLTTASAPAVLAGSAALVTTSASAGSSTTWVLWLGLAALVVLAGGSSLLLARRRRHS